MRRISAVIKIAAEIFLFLSSHKHVRTPYIECKGGDIIENCG